MSLTLDANLQTAQDGNNHRPIVEIKSQSAAPDIPFDGSFLDLFTSPEQKPNVITHSLGSLCLVYVFGNNLKYVYTDVNRTTFTSVDITAPSGFAIHEASLVEITGGNIGIVFYATDGTNDRLYSMVITRTGTTVSGPTQILTAARSAHIYGCPFVIKLAGSDYFLIYTDNTISGATYAIRKRTSADFLTWSAEGTCSIGGLTATKEIQSVSLLQISTGELWLWFDYVDSVSNGANLFNVYYSKSSDSGSTWASATKFTNYATYDTVGKHPIAVQKTANQMHLLFSEILGVIKIDTTATGWDATNLVKTIQIDDVARKMYLVIHYRHPSIPASRYLAFVKIDIDDWTVDKSWHTSSVPAVPANWDVQAGFVSIPRPARGDRHLIPVIGMPTSGVGAHILLLNANSDEFTEYHFEAQAGFSPPMVKNVTVTTNCDTIRSVWIDYDSQRMYALLTKYVNGGTCYYHIGYFDLTEEATTKTFVTIIEMNDLDDYDLKYYLDDYAMNKSISGFIDPVNPLEIVPQSGWAILYIGGVALTPGRTRIHLLSDGSLYKEYVHGHTSGLYPQYPIYGLIKGKTVNGKIYGIYPTKKTESPWTIMDAEYTANNWDGFCVIDVAADTITHYRPDWSPHADYHYGFSHVKLTYDATKAIFNHYGQGVSVYDIAGNTWTLYTNSNVPGLTPGLPPQAMEIDDPNGMIYLGNDSGILGFTILGIIAKTVYQIGTYAAGAWSWSTKTDLCQNLCDYEAVAALHPTTKSLYVFWTNRTGSANTRIKWDTESSEFDLSAYIEKDKDIVVHRSIDGSPASLQFSVTHGHLFDYHNVSSLFSIYLKKGRKLALRFGETVSGSDYWQNQGTFLVRETRLKYERGVYPVMEVSAQDRKCLWDQTNIIATPYYPGSYPEDILKDVLQDNLGFTLSEIDLDNFADREILYQQWLNVSAKDLIAQVCDRFFSFPRMDVDNKFGARKISNANAIDHTYADRTKIIDFTPDDSYSDFTNRVIVEGYGRIDYQVTYPEERVNTLNGTCGWWGFKQNFNIPYSQDESRVCISPRLVVLESSQSIAFQLAGQLHAGAHATCVRDFYRVSGLQPYRGLIPVKRIMGDYIFIGSLDLHPSNSLGRKDIPTNGIPGFHPGARALLHGVFDYFFPIELHVTSQPSISSVTVPPIFVFRVMSVINNFIAVFK